MSADPAGVSPAPIRLSQRLREGTREAHDSVERAAAFNRLIVVRIPAAGPPAEPAAREQALAEYREVYRRFLIATLGFETAVTRALDASPAREEALRSGFELEENDPAALIRSDLREVFEPAAADEGGVMDGLPQALTLAEFAGIEYVRRGSRAGGAVIAASVQHNLGFTRERGASFLAQYGNRTKSLLVALREWLDSLALGAEGEERAVAAAAATFAAVEAWHLRLEGIFAAGR